MRTTRQIPARRIPTTRTGLVWLALLALGLVACGGEESSGENGASGDSESSSIGIALGGPKNDRGFYQAAYEGYKRAAEKVGSDEAVVDALEDPQAQFDAMNNLAQDNDLVIGGGAEFADSAKTLSSQFPDVDFVILTGVVEPGTENLSAYVPRQGVPAYVAGVAAAHLSESGTVGFIGGAEIPPTEASAIAYELGAQSVDPDIKVSSTTIGSFSDAAKAKAAAQAQLASDADQIFAFLDGALPGVIQAIDEAGGENVGLYNPINLHCDDSPNYVGTAVLAVDLLVEQIVDDWSNDAMPDGTEFVALENPEIQRFELCPSAKEDADLVKLVDETVEKINNEEVQFPDGV